MIEQENQGPGSNQNSVLNISAHRFADRTQLTQTVSQAAAHNQQQPAYGGIRVSKAFGNGNIHHFQHHAEQNLNHTQNKGQIKQLVGIDHVSLPLFQPGNVCLNQIDAEEGAGKGAKNNGCQSQPLRQGHDAAHLWHFVLHKNGRQQNNQSITGVAQGKPKEEHVKGCKERHQIQLLMVGQFVDRKSTRLNSSHVRISYAVFCL